MEKINNRNIKEISKIKQFVVIGCHLRKVGIPIHFIGYKYIIEALKFMITSQEPIFINEVYRNVAQQNHVSANSVEVSIRNAIKRALEINNDHIQKIIKNCNSKNLSNAVFLNIMKEIIMERIFIDEF